MNALYSMMFPCVLCPRECRINRLEDEIGFCKVGRLPWVASYGPHFGEESVLVGHGGSGAIFFSGCNLGCIFCQNWDISHERVGQEMTEQSLASLMLALQRRGCHNINFVTPTHVAAAIADGIQVARAAGLTIPTVYNSGGYDSVKALRLLEGLIDIYMPDFKFMDQERASIYLHAADYPEIARAAFKEMHRQTGDLMFRDGLAVRGLLVRHLVMPGCVEDSRSILDFLAKEISPNTYVNVMNQYRPCYLASEHTEIDRRLTADEFEEAWNYAQSKGLRVAE
jgi:putative pyruvate formate lyase activating enzyme